MGFAGGKARMGEGQAGQCNDMQMDISTSHGRRPGIFPCAEISRAGKHGRDRMS